MFKELSKFVKDQITGIDGESYDPARIWAIIFSAGFLFGAMYNLIHLHIPFDLQQFGVGAGALLALGAWGVSIKSHTEPGAK